MSLNASLSTSSPAISIHPLSSSPPASPPFLPSHPLIPSLPRQHSSSSPDTFAVASSSSPSSSASAAATIAPPFFPPSGRDSSPIPIPLSDPFSPSRKDAGALSNSLFSISPFGPNGFLGSPHRRNTKSPQELSPATIAAALVDCIKRQDIHYLHQLLQFADPRILNKKSSSFHKRTLLHRAARHRHNSVEIVRLLLEHGADLRAFNKWNQLPLHEAVIHGNFPVVFELLLRDIDTVNCMDKLGLTPLSYAVLFDHGKIVVLLVDSGAKLTSVRLLPTARATRFGLPDDHPFPKEYCKIGGRNSVAKTLIRCHPSVVEASSVVDLSKFGLEDSDAEWLPWKWWQDVRSLDLRANRFTKIPPGLVCLGPRTAILLAGNPLSSLDMAFIHDQTKLRLYLQGLASAVSLPLPFVKLLILGDAASGKTSLFRALRTCAVTSDKILFPSLGVDQAPLSTDGIDIATLALSSSEQGQDRMLKKLFNELQTALTRPAPLEVPTVHFVCYDFGGQKLYRHTHQLFLSPQGLYLIVWNLQESVKNAVDQIRFWLLSVAHRAAQCPVILVGTHADLLVDPNDKLSAVVGELSHQLRDTISLPVAAIATSILPGHLPSILQLKATLLMEAPKVFPVAPPFLDQIVNILNNHLAESPHLASYPIIPVNLFKSLILDNLSVSVSSEELTRLIDALSALGIILIIRPLDIIILQPQWLAQLFSSVVSTRHCFIKDGILANKHLEHLWRHFPQVLHPQLYRLLQELEVLFPISSGNAPHSSPTPNDLSNFYAQMSLLPSLLPEFPPDIHRIWSDQPSSCELTWNRLFLIAASTKRAKAFIPPGAFSRLICRLSSESKVLAAWSSGAIVACPHNVSVRVELVSVDFDAATSAWGLADIEYTGGFRMYNAIAIAIRSLSSEPAIAALIRRLSAIVQSLLNDMYHIDFFSFVPCPHCPPARGFAFTTDQMRISRAEYQSQIAHGDHRCAISTLCPDLMFLDIQQEDFIIDWNALVLGDQIGSGSFGIVYRAQFKQPEELPPSDHVFAVKMLTSLASSEQAREFEHEVWVMSLLTHPNLVALHGICLSPAAIILEFVGGGTIYDLLHDPFHLRLYERYCDAWKAFQNEILQLEIARNRASVERQPLPDFAPLVEFSRTHFSPLFDQIERWKQIVCEHFQSLPNPSDVLPVPALIPLAASFDSSSSAVFIPSGSPPFTSASLDASIESPTSTSLDGSMGSPISLKASCGAAHPAQAQIDEIDALSDRLRSLLSVASTGVMNEDTSSSIRQLGEQFLTLSKSHFHVCAPLDWSIRLKIAFDISVGMNFLHNLKPPLYHRDLKSPNVFLTRLLFSKHSYFGLEDLRQPLAKIGDFGTAASYDSSTELDDVNPTWLAPELMGHAAAVPPSPAQDVYSMGIILWELISREHPFLTAVPALRHIPEFVISGHRPQIPHECPADYARLIQTCWDHIPDRRPSFATIIQHLTAVALAINVDCHTIFNEILAAATTLSSTDSKIRENISSHLSRLGRTSRPRKIFQLHAIQSHAILVPTICGKPTPLPSRASVITPCEDLPKFFPESTTWRPSDLHSGPVPDSVTPFFHHNYGWPVTAFGMSAMLPHIWVGFSDGRLGMIDFADHSLILCPPFDAHPTALSHIVATGSYVWSLDNSILRVWLDMPITVEDLADISLRGWLRFQKSKRRWGERWFVLENDRLRWFRDPNQITEEGSFALRDITALAYRRDQLDVTYRSEQRTKQVFRSSTVTLTLAGRTPDAGYLSYSTDPSLFQWTRILSLDRYLAARSPARSLLACTERSFPSQFIVSICNVNSYLWTIDKSGHLCEWEITDSTSMTGIRTSGLAISPRRKLSLELPAGSSHPSLSCMPVNHRLCWVIIGQSHIHLIDQGEWGSPLQHRGCVEIANLAAIAPVVHPQSKKDMVWLATVSGELFVCEPEVLPDLTRLTPHYNIGANVSNLIQISDSLVWATVSDLLIMVPIQHPNKPQCIFVSGLVRKYASIPNHFKTNQSVKSSDISNAGIAVAQLGGCLFWLSNVLR